MGVGVTVMLALILVVSGLIAVSGVPQTTVFPHGHALVVLIDKGFEALDHNPKDGIVTKIEWDAIQKAFDNDTDNCVTAQEYQQQAPNTPPAVMTTLYTHYDHNHDNCMRMDDMLAEFHLVDKDKSGDLTEHEVEHYYSHLFNQLFGQGSHVVG